MAEAGTVAEGHDSRHGELQAIFAIVDAIAGAADLDEVAEAAVRAVCQTLRVDRAALLLADEGDTFRFRAWECLSDAYREASQGHSPWAKGEIDPKPVTVEDVAQDESLGPLRPTVLAEGISALAFVPLVAGRRLLGKFMLYYNQPHAFSEAELRVSQAVASHVAIEIERRGAERRLAALESLSLAGLQADTTEDVLPILLDRTRRALQAERAAVLLLDTDSDVLRMHRTVGLEGEDIGEVRVPLGAGVAGTIALRGAPMVVADLSKVPVVSRYLREHGGSLAGVPLHMHGKVGGVLHVSTDTPGRFHHDDVELLEAVGDRVSLILERTELRQREHQMVETLQRSLLPERLPQVPGIAISAHYRPGAEGVDIGGDWYDALLCQDGMLAFAVGDVVGKGLTAAATMGQLRNALRAYAFVGNDPAATLTHVSDLIESLELSTFATVFTGKVNPETGTLSYSSAGHPPAVLVQNSEAVLLEDAQSVPLGVLESGFRARQGNRAMSEGDVLLAFTDGLVERRDRPIAIGIEQVIEAARNPAQTCDDLIANVLTTLLERAPEDDVALLAFQLVTR